MAKKTATKQEEKAVAKTAEKKPAKVQKEKKKQSWAGAGVFMEKAVPGSTEEKEQKLIRITAKALNISPFGVNILGDLPYINKLGLALKVSEYTNGQVKFLTNWVQLATDDTMKAICQKKLVYTKNGVEYEGEQVIGECSPATTKMGTLKGYQNQIAETRAKNRAMLAEFGARIHLDLMNGIQALVTNKEVTSKEAAKIGNSVSSSAEEIQTDTNEKVYTPQDMDAKARKEFLAYARTKGAKIGSEIQFIADTLELGLEELDFENLKQGETLKLKTMFMAKASKPDNGGANA